MKQRRKQKQEHHKMMLDLSQKEEDRRARIQANKDARQARRQLDTNAMDVDKPKVIKKLSKNRRKEKSSELRKRDKMRAALL